VFVCPRLGRRGHDVYLSVSNQSISLKLAVMIGITVERID